MIVQMSRYAISLEMGDRSAARNEHDDAGLAFLIDFLLHGLIETRQPFR